MAVELSDKMVEIANKNIYGQFYSQNNSNNKITKFFNYILILKLRVKVYSINIYRKFIRKISTFKNDKFSNIEIRTNIVQNSDLIKDQINKKGYLFLENFLNHEFYKFLNDNFPKKNLLNKSNSPLKNYNIGFIYLKNERNPDLKSSKVLDELYKFITSSKFENQVNEIFNLKEKKLYCKNIITSIAEPNSFLIPHKDHISIESNDLNINFIYFVDGNQDNLEYSGATCIYEDNNAETTLLKPKTLKNSLLIYDNTNHFFHGFKVMKENCFRKAISFQFNIET